MLTTTVLPTTFASKAPPAETTTASPESEVTTTTTAAAETENPVTAPPFVSEQFKCSQEFCEHTLSEDYLLKYKVNTPEKTVSMELIYDGIAWLGLALSADGQMVGSEAIM